MNTYDKWRPRSIGKKISDVRITKHRKILANSLWDAMRCLLANRTDDAEHVAEVYIAAYELLEHRCGLETPKDLIELANKMYNHKG